MKYLFLLICLMVPLMGSECSSPDRSYHEQGGNVAPVPEPSSALIFGLGLIVGCGYCHFKKKRK